MALAEKILSFQKKLALTVKLPKGVEVLNPYQEKIASQLCNIFYKRFYNDDASRTIILGINPGRFGGGLTGIPFTDPTQLDKLGIENTLDKKAELSSDFIYRMIHHFGGTTKFYQHFYFSSISPLGFTQDGKNLNYYDIKSLPKLLDSFIIKCMKEQLGWGLNRQICYCLGEGENFKFLKALNEKEKFFEGIIPLAHPRFIMQYKRKKLTEYLDDYARKLNIVTGS